MRASAEINSTLAIEMARFAHDPLGFVEFSFPWGSGPLEGKQIFDWQREVLEEIGAALRIGAITAFDAIRIARASGHGIGKSALVAWLILWAMATHEDTRGIVTANTEAQLKNKTWPELATWYRICIIREWFKYTATSLFSADQQHEKNWRIDLVAWSENNTEAFAGLHNAGKRILLVFDEASAIPDSIWEVSEGALTDEDTEIIWVAFGNPTRNQGRFFDCFNKTKHRWRQGQIDSRTVPGTNKRQLQQWVDDYGEDSDFVRVRVRGIFPRASSMQFIGRDLVDEAMKRPMNYRPPKVAVVGVDVARFGDDDSVIRTRMGRDARQFEPIRMKHATTTALSSAIADHVSMLRGLGIRVVIMVDGTGGYGGNVVDKLREMGYDVVEVLFSAKADNPKKYFNKRAEMYGRMREWLKVGHLEEDEDLAKELTAVMYRFQNDRVQLEPKEVLKDREGFSPDDADSLALTFAYPVEELAPEDPLRRAPASDQAKARRAYDPMSRV